MARLVLSSKSEKKKDRLEINPFYLYLFFTYPGCQIIYRPEIHTKFGPSNLMCGTSLDDKAGIWIIAESMKNLAGKIPAEY